MSEIRDFQKKSCLIPRQIGMKAIQLSLNSAKCGQ